MEILMVVPLDPGCQRLLQLDGAGPLPEPQEFFLERPHHPFRVGIALGIVVAGEGLREGLAIEVDT